MNVSFNPLRKKYIFFCYCKSISGIIPFSQAFNFLAFSGEQDHFSEAYRTRAKSAISRGGSRFRGTWSLYNFEAPYKIKCTKLRIKN